MGILYEQIFAVSQLYILFLIVTSNIFELIKLNKYWSSSVLSKANLKVFYQNLSFLLALRFRVYLFEYVTSFFFQKLRVRSDQKNSFIEAFYKILYTYLKLSKTNTQQNQILPFLEHLVFKIKRYYIYMLATYLQECLPVST